jgi:formylglycine-generating enzyme required for sulfatase activity
VTGLRGNDAIAALVQALSEQGLDLQARDVADAYWLSRVMVRGEQQALAPVSLLDPPHLPSVSPPPPAAAKSPEAGIVRETPSVPVDRRAVPVATVSVHLAPKTEPIPGLPVEVPAPSGLPEQSVVMRALRPLLERAPSRHRQMFDAEATARRRAEERILEPVLAPVRERWLNVSLLLDVSGSMDVWRPTLRDLRGLLEKAGAFRSVRVWDLLMDRSEPLLRLAVRGGSAAEPSNRPLQVLGLGGRTLILIVTDCVSSAWASGCLVDWLREWSRLAVVGVVQILPPWLWPRTFLGDAQAGKLRPGGAGFGRGAIWQSDWPLELDSASIPLPVVPLTQEDLPTLAGFLAGRGRAEVRGYRMIADHGLQQSKPVSEESGEAIVKDFRSSASRPARRLAALLAAAPVINLPVIRLLGEATGVMPTRCRAEHLAEVWLAGLLQADPGRADAEDPDEVIYDFRTGARDALLDGLAWSDARQVLEQVSDYVERNLGRLRGLRGYLRNPTEAPKLFDPADRPFALIAAQVLRRLGGEYGALAKQIEQQVEGKTVRFGVWLRELRDLAQEWVKEQGSPGHASPQTTAYVDLIFAFGLARLGEKEAARELQARAQGALKDRDAAHQFLCGAYEYRIRQALDGKRHSGQLPTDQLQYLEHMDRLLRYVVDRLRKHSFILEPDERINPYRYGPGQRTGFQLALAELTDLTDKAQVEARVEQMLKDLPKGARGSEQRARVLQAGLEVAPRVNEAFAKKLLEQVVPTYESLPEAEEVVALLDQAGLLEKAMLVAVHFDRTEHVHSLVARFQHLLQSQRGAQALQALDSLAGQCFRGLRKLNMCDQIEVLLRQMAELVLEGQDVKNIDFRKRENGPAALRALLHVAGGWYYFAKDNQAEPIIQAARTLLLQGEPLPPREQTWLAAAYARALGQAPVEVAQTRLEEIFRQRKGVRDTYTTSSHFSVSQLDVVESVVLAAVECVLSPRSQQPKPGITVSLAPGVEMKFAYIPPGSFFMGSPESEEGRSDNEGPQHRVTLEKGFYLGIYPVTQAQWQAVMGNNPSHFQGENLPVEMVSWVECVEFCRKLSERDGHLYRLPTEAEWEYACRAGTTTPFAFGETITTDQVNYDGNYPDGGGKKGVSRQRTTPVGSFPANAWGLFDMHGNVWNWCHDWFDARSYTRNPSNAALRPHGGLVRVNRGGSWHSPAWRCRSAFRGNCGPTSGSNRLGFRVALGPSVQGKEPE